MGKRILLHPDIFFSGHSGAIAAREAARQLNQLGYEVGVFTHDQPGAGQRAEYPCFKRLPYTGKANYFRSAYRNTFLQAVKEFRPDFMFFIGGIINTPVVYADICRREGIRTVFLLLVQDFFCARLHAGLGNGSCTRCLGRSGWASFIHRCGDKQPRPFLYMVNYQVVRRLVLPRLRRIDTVLGSTEEQLGFYRRAGVDPARTRKIPLFFDQRRVFHQPGPPGDYFVIVGQYRHEKGIHLISGILDQLRAGIRVKVMFFNQKEADRFVSEYPANEAHIRSGKLEVLPGVNMTNGGVELIAGSRGVINPSIWATTTEFVLLEVLGLSRPVITFAVGIHREVLVNGINGICVEAGDFAGMAREIHRLADDSCLADRIGNAAKGLYHKLTDEAVFIPVLREIFG